MSSSSLSRYLMFCSIIAIFTSSLAQVTGTTNTGTTVGSGDDTTTAPEGSGGTEPTEDTCSCKSGVICPESCVEGCAVGNEIRDNNFICAEPCDVDFYWGCDMAGQICEIAGNSTTCVCGGNYYDSAGVCEKALKFGGTMKFDGTYNSSQEEPMKLEVEEVLDQIYNTSGSGYLGSVVIDVRNGSIIADYQLIYASYSGATDDSVTEAYDQFIKEVNVEDCTTSILGCPTVNSLNSTIACEGVELECDGTTSNCGSDNGTITCVCDNTKRYGKPSSDATYCSAFNCIEDDDCNPPFGECENHGTLDSRCKCTVFGWSGTYCTNPWEFVFTIVTAGLGLILICVLTACIITTKKGKTVQKTPKHEDMDLQNPFVDFQPGLVRAKVPTNAYSLSDSYEATNGAQAHTNGAFEANEGARMQTSTFSGGQQNSSNQNYEYF